MQTTRDARGYKVTGEILVTLRLACLLICVFPIFSCKQCIRFRIISRSHYDPGHKVLEILLAVFAIRAFQFHTCTLADNAEMLFILF